jgi:hypothetical protein
MAVEYCWEGVDLSMRKNATQGVRRRFHFMRVGLQERTTDRSFLLNRISGNLFIEQNSFCLESVLV